MNETMYIVPKSELKDLLEAAYSYWALEQGGVDNWNWYGESIRNFVGDWNANNFVDAVDIEEIAEYELRGYDEVI